MLATASKSHPHFWWPEMRPSRARLQNFDPELLTMYMYLVLEGYAQEGLGAVHFLPSKMAYP